MKELVEIIAKSLVDCPDEVVVNETIEADTVTIELKVAPDDIGNRQAGPYCQVHSYCCESSSFKG